MAKHKCRPLLRKTAKAMVAAAAMFLRSAMRALNPLPPFHKQDNRFPEVRLMNAGKSLLLIAVGSATIGAVPVSAQMHMPDHYDRQFDKAEEWAKTFDDPARDPWQQPERVIAALAIAPNAAVVDIGSGTGYFAVRLARSLPQGRVLGIDIQPDMVHYLNERAHREGLANLASRLGTKDDPKVPWPIDLAIVLDTYHHIGGRDRYFQRVREKLKPGGRLVIIDFRQDAVLGPPRHFRISPEHVKQELSKAGFEFVKEETFLPQQYLLVFQAAR